MFGERLLQVGREDRDFRRDAFSLLLRCRDDLVRSRVALFDVDRLDDLLNVDARNVKPGFVGRDPVPRCEELLDLRPRSKPPEVVRKQPSPCVPVGSVQYPGLTGRGVHCEIDGPDPFRVGVGWQPNERDVRPVGLRVFQQRRKGPRDGVGLGRENFDPFNRGDGLGGFLRPRHAGATVERVDEHEQEDEAERDDVDPLGFLHC